MPSRTEYLEVKPGETHHWNLRQPVTIICCDCGLAHLFKFEPRTRYGFIAVKAWRDNRRTAIFRRRKSKRLQTALKKEAHAFQQDQKR